MSLLALATARKGLEQESQLPGATYIPLENRSTWTMDWLPAEAKALSIATFYGAVRVLSETFAMLPLMVYRRLEGGGKARATDHPLWPVLHDDPNPEMDTFQWRELVMQNLVTWGNHYSEKLYDPFGRLQLWPLRPDRMEVYWDSRSRKRYRYTKASGERKDLELGSVFHVAGMGSDGLKGYSLLSLHRKTFEGHDAPAEFGRSMFRNNARPGVVLSHPKSLSDPAILRLKAQMDELRGSANANKTVVLEEGLALHEVGIPPKDAQYLESRVFSMREINTLMRMQPHKNGDLERATFTNIGEQNQEFIQDTMMPWFTRFEKAGKRQLLAGDLDHFIGFLVIGYLRGNAKDRAEALQIRRQNGTISADEWRELEDENPLPDDLGKEFWMPVNMAPVGQPIQGEPVKSAGGELRCGSCNKLILRHAPPGVEGDCPRCKAPLGEPSSNGYKRIELERDTDGRVTALREA